MAPVLENGVKYYGCGAEVCGLAESFEGMSAMRAICAGMRHLDLREGISGVLAACSVVPGGEGARLWLRVDGRWLLRSPDGKLTPLSQSERSFPPAVLDAATGRRVCAGDAMFQPLAHNGRVVAVLELPDAVGERVLALVPLELMGAAIGACIDADAMQRGFVSALERLAGILEARDPYSRGHSERVARYALELARLLGCTPDESERIYHAALLHDLGKAGIAAGILEKPGALSENELNIVRRHPKDGADVLGTLPFLHDVAEIVRFHHEWYNGEGYNDGLRASEIPLGARIVAVADAFAAMTADRPYRRALPLPKVIERLRKGAGVQWDANIVDAMLGIIADGRLD